MLPKLQQSSLANTLRRDNLASQIQCTCCSMQARTSSRALSASRTTKPTNRGRILMRPKTRTVPSATFLRSTSLGTNSRKRLTNQSTNSRSLARWPSTPNIRAAAAGLPALSRRRTSSKNQCRSLAPSRREKCLLLSSEGITTVAICPSASITRTRCLN